MRHTTMMIEGTPKDLESLKQEHRGEHVILRAELSADPDGDYHILAEPAGPLKQANDQVVTNTVMTLAHALMLGASDHLSGPAKALAKIAAHTILEAAREQEREVGS